MTDQAVFSELLSDGQRRALLALVEHSTLEEAARAAKLSPRTVRRYLEDPLFLDEYRRLRRAVWEQAVAELQTACTEAVKTLRTNLEAKSEAAQIRAARTILDHARSGLEITDMLERLEALERRMLDA